MKPVKGNFKKIPIQLIRSPDQSSREVFEGIGELAQTIKTHGLLQPITVKKLEDNNGFEVLIGSRRFKACQRAGLKVIPSIVVDGLSKEQILEMQVVENLQRSDLLPYEEMRLVRSLRDLELTNEEIAAKIGCSPATIGDLVIVSEKIPEDIQKLVVRVKGGKPAKRELTISKAVLLARAGLSAEKLRDMIRLIRLVGYSRQQLANKLAKSYKSKIRRVHASRTLYHELTSKLKDYVKNFAEYWSDYCNIEEHEDLEAFHLVLKIDLPKDLNEAKGKEGEQTTGS